MDLTFNKNEDHHKLQLSELKKRYAGIKKGGGDKRIQKLHDEGKMTARERIDYLLEDAEEARERGAGHEVIRALKQTLDPKNIMNPGKLGL